jgi:hypothetical protein
LPAENQAVNPTFNISGSNATGETTHLFINAGMQGIAFTEWEKESNTFISVLVYHFAKSLSKTEVATAIEDILNSAELLQKYFSKTAITWCFSETVLVPHEYFEKATRNEMLGMVYGSVKDSFIKDELILQHNLHTIYAVPTAVENSINKKFPYCLQSHQSSLLINLEGNEKDLLYCHFYTDSLTVVLRKKGQLQLIQNFEFSTPEDVVYHVLNVCRGFDVDATQTIVTVSGMIDASSNLYNELYKYVAAINFYALPVNFNYADEIKNHPAHYFSHLFATAACVL